MRNPLLNNIRQLSNDINILETDEPMSTERILKLESMFQLCDRLVECSRQTPKTLKRYNKLKRRYTDITDPYKGLNSEIAACRMHIEAFNRQNRIVDISKGVQELVAISDYINYMVESKRYSIDSITESLEQGERYGELANEQIDAARGRRSWKTRILRSTLFFILILVSTVTFIRIRF